MRTWKDTIHGDEDPFGLGPGAPRLTATLRLATRHGRDTRVRSTPESSDDAQTTIAIRGWQPPCKLVRTGEGGPGRDPG